MQRPMPSAHVNASYASAYTYIKCLTPCDAYANASPNATAHANAYGKCHPVGAYASTNAYATAYACDNAKRFRVC